MKKRISIISLVLIALMLQGCSWVEYFVIRNESSVPVSVEYELSSATNGFPIFYSAPSLYPLKESGSIHWEKKLDLSDEDPGPLIVRFSLPPKSVAVIGGLMNDKYTSHDQYFINGRVFNLKNLRISCRSATSEISPANFDDVFKKKNGQISYTIP